MNPYNFTVQRKVTFPGVQFAIKVNDAPLDLSGASILCQFRKKPNAAVVLELDDGAGITIITPPTAGIFGFDEQVFDLGAGSYGYDIAITLSSGKIVNYVYGTMTVLDVFSIPAT